MEPSIILFFLTGRAVQFIGNLSSDGALKYWNKLVFAFICRESPHITIDNDDHTRLEFPSANSKRDDY